MEVEELCLFLNLISVYGTAQLGFQSHRLHAFLSGVGKCSILACKMNFKLLLVVLPLYCSGSNVWISKFCTWQVLAVVFRFIVYGLSFALVFSAGRETIIIRRTREHLHLFCKFHLLLACVLVVGQ